MAQSWFYQHAGETNGPISTEQLKKLIGNGALAGNAFVWPLGSNSNYGITAEAAMGLSNREKTTSIPSASPVPDWLDDVKEMQRKGPVPPPQPTHENPEWLEDLRLWLGLDLVVANKLPVNKAETSNSNQGQTGKIPDWLESWHLPEANKEFRPDQIPTPPALSMPSSPLPPPPVTHAGPPGTSNRPEPPPVSGPSSISPKRQTPTSVQPAATNPAVVVFAQNLANKALAETGFDLQTGQILDPEKFQKWKQQPAQPSGVSSVGTNASFFDIFRKARFAIEQWVDDEKNRLRVRKSDVSELKKTPEVLAILHEYAGYGKQMQEKLLHHLEFMVENRRKYYKALEGR